MNRLERRQAERIESQQRAEAQAHAKIKKITHGLWAVHSGRHSYGTAYSLTAAIALRRETRRSK